MPFHYESMLHNFPLHATVARSRKQPMPTTPQTTSIIAAAPRNSQRQESLDRLQEYLHKYRGRLSYPQRLAEGRAIGGVQVEGACKHMIARRLKQTGTRWQLRRVNRIADLCAMLYSDHRDAYRAASPP